jgi:hypothetical protein
MLGCDTPMLLRPTETGDYNVVGACFIQGLMDGEGILGPLPPGLVTRISSDQVQTVQHFDSTLTGETSVEDPRLPPLPAPWEQVDLEPDDDTPSFVKFFRNKQTGELVTSDPRLLPVALKERGIQLETFRLV